MPLALYDLTVPRFAQTLGAVDAFLKKAEAHFSSHGVSLDDVVETRLVADMLPFRFQLVSVAHHSLGALRGVMEGEFGPPPRPGALSYGDLQNLIVTTRDALQALLPADVNRLEGKDVVFKLGDYKATYVAESFLTSFSFPNFYFHAATAYDILRLKGAPLGKRDFLGVTAVKG